MRAIICGIVATLTAACSTSPPSLADATGAALDEPVDDATVFTETGLALDPHGALIAVSRSITAGEERAQADARAHLAAGEAVPRIARDSTCAGASFWLYDRTDYTGNRVCYAGAGTWVRLESYRLMCHFGASGAICTPVWLETVGSFWAGSSPGHLGIDNVTNPTIDAGGPPPVETTRNFGTYEQGVLQWISLHTITLDR
jgi:hypothetical protein